MKLRISLLIILLQTKMKRLKPSLFWLWSRRKQEPIKIICEAFKTYIICEYGSKSLLIDKHALHERILFNDLKKIDGGLFSGSVVPASVTLSMKEYDALLENLIFKQCRILC